MSEDGYNCYDCDDTGLMRTAYGDVPCQECGPPLDMEYVRQKTRADEAVRLLRLSVDRGHREDCQASMTGEPEKYPCDCDHDAARAFLDEHGGSE